MLVLNILFLILILTPLTADTLFHFKLCLRLKLRRQIKGSSSPRVYTLFDPLSYGSIVEVSIGCGRTFS